MNCISKQQSFLFLGIILNLKKKSLKIYQIKEKKVF